MRTRATSQWGKLGPTLRCVGFSSLPPLSIGVARRARKSESIRELFYVLVDLTPTQIHFRREFSLSFAADRFRRDHPRKNHRPVEHSPLLKFSVVQNPLGNFFESVGEFFDRIKFLVRVRKSVEDFERKICGRNPLTSRSHRVRISSRMFSSVVHRKMRSQPDQCLKSVNEQKPVTE